MNVQTRKWTMSGWSSPAVGELKVPSVEDLVDNKRPYSLLVVSLPLSLPELLQYKVFKYSPLTFFEAYRGVAQLSNVPSEICPGIISNYP